jgi:hypothetical protein
MTTLFNQAHTVAVPRVRPTSPPRSLLAAIVVAAALFGIVGATAATARADADTGGNYLGALSSNGITFASGQAAIAAGRQVCDALDQGKQASDVANQVMTQSSLDGFHAGFFVGASIAAMCPRHSQ